MSTDADVVVVGAGIGGLAAALLLARSGGSVTLLERATAPADGGAGLLLQSNGLAVLTGLGLGEHVRGLGQAVPGLDLRGTDSAPIPIARSDEHDVGGQLLAVRRSALHQVLLAAVARESSVACRFDATVTSATPGGEVDLRWRSKVSTIRADLVVGADGVHSTVRSGGDFSARTRHSGASYLRGLVPRADLAVQSEWWTPLGVFGGAPVDADTLYFYAAASSGPVAAALGRKDLGGLRRVWEEVLPIAGQVLRRVNAFTDLLHDDVTRVDCRNWYDGRLVLIGDAAHAMAPNLGQGANSALVDAAVLATELDLAGDRADALAGYYRRRSTAVRRVQDRADLVARLSAWSNPLARSARNVGLRALTRLPGAWQRTERLLAQEDPRTLIRSVRALG